MVAMSVGGVDILLLAPAQECVADLILRACQRHWHGSECHFQHADQAEAHSLREAWVWTRGTASREFFVYRDRQAFSDWGLHGAVRSNQNSMFHFLIGSAVPASGLVEVTLVCDRLTGEVKQLVGDLRNSFLDGAADAGYREAA
jgi:hypothetical protein